MSKKFKVGDIVLIKDRYGSSDELKDDCNKSGKFKNGYFFKEKMYHNYTMNVTKVTGNMIMCEKIVGEKFNAYITYPSRVLRKVLTMSDIEIGDYFYLRKKFKKNPGISRIHIVEGMINKDCACIAWTNELTSGNINIVDDEGYSYPIEAIKIMK